MTDKQQHTQGLSLIPTANLISAAPELLDALEGLLREVGNHIGKRDVKKHYSLMVYEQAARQAIAKAKGTDQ